MNRFVPTKEALDILSAHAPRTWCKKMLSSLMLDGVLTAYALSGHLVGRVPISVLLDDDTIAPSEGEKFWSAVKEKYGPGAPTEERGKPTSRGTLFPITGFRWYDNDSGSEHPIGFGYFYYADSLDWEAGTLSINSMFPNEVVGELFFEDDGIFHAGGNLAEPRFSWIEFEVQLGGLSFDRGAIEMLTGVEQPRGRASIGPVGRHRKWDWEGVLAFVAAEANRNPDGLPDGYGAQAKLEKMMSDWFISHSNEAPAESEVRLRAQKILAAIQEGRKP